MPKTRNLSLIMSFFLFFTGISTSCQGNLIRDAELESRLEGFLKPLLEKAEVSSSINVRIILNSSYNAFVASDDVIYLHSGLLLEAETLEEVIGVMAHELGHIVSGHVVRKSESLEIAKNASSLSTALAAAAAIGGSGELATSLFIGGNDRVARQFYYGSRVNEAVADEWALKMLDELEISAVSMANMMKRLSRQNVLPESYQSEYYRTHPGNKQRLAVYEDHVAKSILKDKRMPLKDYKIFNRIVVKLAGYQNRPEQTIEKLKNKNLSVNQKYQRAIAYLRYGDLEAAKEDIDTILSIEPNNPYFYELAGEIAFAKKELETALKYFYEAYDKSEGAPLIALRLGRVLLASETFENYIHARNILKIAVSGEPRLPFARREYAIALGKTGDMTRASWQLAEAAYLRNDLQEASVHIERALAKPDLTPDLKEHLLDLKFLIMN